MPENLNELKKYRIQQAYDTIAEVEFQIANNYLNTAVTRTDSDYGIFIVFEKAEVQNKVEEMKEFISKIEELINI